MRRRPALVSQDQWNPNPGSDADPNCFVNFVIDFPQE